MANKAWYTSKHIPYFICFFWFVTLPLCGLAQPKDAGKTDTTSQKAPRIELSEVSIKSAETQIKTKKIIENLITQAAIQKLQKHSDSILYVVDTSLVGLKQQMFQTKSIRYLENRKLRLGIQQRKIEQEKALLAGIVNQLSASIEYVSKENNRWKTALKRYEESGQSEVVVKRLKNSTAFLDSAIVQIAQKNESILGILDDNTEMSINIQEQIDNTTRQITALQSGLFRADHPSLFALKYTGTSNWQIRDKVKRFFANDYYELQQYLSINRMNLVLTTLVFFLFLYLFVQHKNRAPSSESGFGYLYKVRFSKIISRPISAAIILAFMFAVTIFRDRPLAFRDVSGYIIILPLWFIMRVMVARRFYFVVNTMVLLVVPYILFIMLPPENVLFRINLFFLSAIEVYLMARYLFFTFNGLELKKNFYTVLKFFGYLFFAFSIVGLVAGVNGNLMLSEIMLLTVYTSILVGAVLHISVMSLNGFLMFFIESDRARQLNFIRNNELPIKKSLTRMLSVGAVIYWVYFLLHQLKIDDEVGQALSTFFGREWAIGSVTFNAGTVLTFFLVIYLSIILSNIVKAILADDVLDKFTLPKGMGYTIAVVVKYTLVTAGLFLAVSAAGMDFTSLTVIMGAFGVGIGFGLQTIFNNLVSGLILLFERPIQIGDTIEVGALIGEVKSIGIRSSNVRTYDGAEVIVPNGNLISAEVVNWTLSDQRRRIEIIVGVSYNSEPRQVHQLLSAILANHPDVLTSPEPVVRFQELGESSLDFRMLFWTANFSEWVRIRSEVIFDIFDVLKQNNVEIPFPQRDIHVRSIEESLKVQQDSTRETKA